MFRAKSSNFLTVTKKKLRDNWLVTIFFGDDGARQREAK